MKIKTQLIKYSPVVIMLIAFVLRMLVFNAISDEPSRYFQTDSGQYQKLAENLLQYQVFGAKTEGDSWRLETNRTPLYPTFLALTYRIFGLLPAKAMLAQILLSVVVVALAFRFGRIWGGFQIGVLSAFLLSIELGSILYASQLMTETLFNLFFLGGLVFWSTMLNQQRWQYGLLCGAMLGLGALVRPVLFYFGGMLCVFTLLFYKDKLRNKIFATLGIAIVFALIVGPWVARNHTILGLAQISTNQNSYMYNAVIRLHAFQQNILYSEAKAQIDQEIGRDVADGASLKPGELALYYQQLFVSKAQSNLWGYTVFHSKGAAMFFVMPTAGVVARTLNWLPEGGTGLQVNLLNRSAQETWQAFQSFRQKLPQNGYSSWLFFGTLAYELVFLLLVNIGSVAGLIICFWTKRWRLALLAILSLGYFAAITGPLAYDARYRLPIMPIMLLLTSFTTILLARRFLKHKSTY